MSSLGCVGLSGEGGVGGDNAADSPVAVGKVGGDGQLALLTNLHSQEALVPAFDDMAGADFERERLAAVVAFVKLVAIGEFARVVHVNFVAYPGALAVMVELDSEEQG